MNLEEALKLYDKAKEQGLVGEWPKALICLAENFEALLNSFQDQSEIICTLSSDVEELLDEVDSLKDEIREMSHQRDSD